MEKFSLSEAELKGLRTEIMAGSVLFVKTDADRSWNAANVRACSLIDNYLKGCGIFQIAATKFGEDEATKALNRATRNLQP